jgi:hypothetical protein
MTDAHYVKRLYWQSFAVRFGAGLLGWFLTFVLGLPLMEDANFYEEAGSIVAQDWLRGRSSVWLDDAIERNRNGWVMVAVIAACYTAMGGIRFLPALIALFCLVTSWAPVLTYRIGRQLGQQPATARVGARLVAYSPAFAFWSGALYKEGLILLVLNLLVYHALRLQANPRTRSVLVVCGCLLSLLGLRFYLAALAALTVLPNLVFFGMRGTPASRNSGKLLLRQALTVILLVQALVDFGRKDSILDELPTSTEAALGRIDKSRRDLAVYSSRYLEDADVGTPEKALAFMPVGTLYFLTVPFPWQSGSLRQNLVIPETLCWLALYPLIVFYGIYVGNIGTAYRMRIQVWLLASLFVGWGWEQVRSTSRKPERRWRVA